MKTIAKKTIVAAIAVVCLSLSVQAKTVNASLVDTTKKSKMSKMDKMDKMSKMDKKMEKKKMSKEKSAIGWALFLLYSSFNFREAA